MKNKKRTLPLIVILFIGTTFEAPDFDTAPEEQTHIIKIGETLWDLSRECYGNRHFSRIILLHNNIEDETKLHTGQTIHVPDLKTLLEREGLFTIAKTEMEYIVDSYAIMRNSQSQNERGKYFIEAADLLNKASSSLRHNEHITSLPEHMIKRIEEAAELMNRLAVMKQGSSYFSKHFDLAEQKIVSALYNAIKWARNGFE
ncbi:MAG: LysM peptidoglycan-binding domain-containing protein [Chitinispirillaceae bacterium]|nr:LysM peptidoglycan-binding domain-containing protein [Chitinispirillaceae bacterium]